MIPAANDRRVGLIKSVFFTFIPLINKEANQRRRVGTPTSSRTADHVISERTPKTQGNRRASNFVWLMLLGTTRSIITALFPSDR
jgi:hypothetical protein